MLKTSSSVVWSKRPPLRLLILQNFGRDFLIGGRAKLKQLPTTYSGFPNGREVLFSWGLLSFGLTKKRGSNKLKVPNLMARIPVWNFMKR